MGYVVGRAEGRKWKLEHLWVCGFVVGGSRTLG